MRYPSEGSRIRHDVRSSVYIRYETSDNRLQQSAAVTTVLQSFTAVLQPPAALTPLTAVLYLLCSRFGFMFIRKLSLMPARKRNRTAVFNWGNNMQFCPKCKSLMTPIKGEFRCRKCNYTYNIKEEDKENLSFKSEINDKEIVVLDGNDGEALPTIEERCPECGNQTAYWWLRQLRSADESETRFFRCTKCGNTWREYD